MSEGTPESASTPPGAISSAGAGAAPMWYYASSGERRGPVELASLLELAGTGVIVPHTLVWRAGMVDWVAAAQAPELAGRLAALEAAPPTVRGAVPAEAEDNAVELIIPYRNGAALAAYYCGVFSLIPVLGLVPGVLAVAFGVAGLKTARREVRARGRVHAVAGLVLGGLSCLAHAGFVAYRLIRP